MSTQQFHNRQDAGRQLGAELSKHKHDDVIVLGLPRGGVPVAYEVASLLDAPLDIVVVRKLGVPDHEEMAMGAIASGGARVMNEETVNMLNLQDSQIEAVITREEQELKRREQAYRDNRPQPNLDGKTVLLVDDGMATGATMRAAAHAVRQQNPKKVIVAVPVASIDACRDVGHLTDETVCLRTPPSFRAVGLWYEEFGQTTDDEVRDLLHKAYHEHTVPE